VSVSCADRLSHPISVWMTAARLRSQSFCHRSVLLDCVDVDGVGVALRLVIEHGGDLVDRRMRVLTKELRRNGRQLARDPDRQLRPGVVSIRPSLAEGDLPTQPPQPTWPGSIRRRPARALDSAPLDRSDAFRWRAVSCFLGTNGRIEPTTKARIQTSPSPSLFCRLKACWAIGTTGANSRASCS
jgi:hypothetical protein